MKQVTRQSVRALATEHQEAMKNAGLEGRNVYQLSLDQRDELDEIHTVGMSESDKTRFYELYAQELNAITSDLEEQTEAINKDTQEKLDKQQDERSHIRAVIIVLLGVAVVVFGAIQMQ